MLRAFVDSIAIAADGSSPIVLLRTEDDALVPIAVSPEQALSISLGQEEDANETSEPRAATRAAASYAQGMPKRPMTHDLLLSVLQMLRAQVVRVEICGLREGIFYGQLVLEHRGLEYDIDARPSDLLALSVRNSTPIFLAQEVVEAMGFEDITDIPEGSVEA